MRPPDERDDRPVGTPRRKKKPYTLWAYRYKWWWMKFRDHE